MLKKVVVIGPESTGKSTVSEALSDHYQCPWVPEFAREYIDKLNRPYSYADLEEIAKGQVLFEDKAAEKAKKLIICDTNLYVLKVWSEHKFGKVSTWILNQIAQRKYDLYLITDIDIAWTEDPQREHPEPEMRRYFLDWYKKLVQQSGVPFKIIAGAQEDRKEKAIHLIDEHLIKINQEKS